MIRIGPKTFRTLADAAKRCREIAARHDPGQPIPSPDHEFLWYLLAKHPDVETKLCGFRHFVVLIDPAGNRCFGVAGVDGIVDFSWRKCLKQPTPIQSFRSAARTAIRPSIIAFREAAFALGPVACPITGTPLTPETCHVDHTPPWTFDAIVRAYLEINPVPDVIDIGFGANLADPAPFRAFHDARARLRAVSQIANLTILRTHDIP